jgi:hypothetical protein
MKSSFALAFLAIASVSAAPENKFECDTTAPDWTEKEDDTLTDTENALNWDACIAAITTIAEADTDKSWCGAIYSTFDDDEVDNLGCKLYVSETTGEDIRVAKESNPEINEYYETMSWADGEELENCLNEAKEDSGVCTWVTGGPVSSEDDIDAIIEEILGASNLATGFAVSAIIATMIA